MDNNRQVATQMAWFMKAGLLFCPHYVFALGLIASNHIWHMSTYMALLEQSSLFVSCPLGIPITNGMVVDKVLGFMPHFTISGT